MKNLKSTGRDYASLNCLTILGKILNNGNPAQNFLPLRHKFYAKSSKATQTCPSDVIHDSM